MTITREQVARAIEVARADEGGISDALGGWQWDKRAPDYVRVAWGKPSLPDFIAALTRWHAELAAVATPRAAEAERAAKPDHLAYADSPVWDDGPLPTPTPERPAPRFKVGEWVRVTKGPDKPHMLPAFRKAIAEMRAGGASLSEVADAYWLGIGEVSEALDAESMAPERPAPEVVDVPQPIVKRCACSDIHDDVEAEWRPGEPYLTVTHTTVPLAILRAMLEAIDAQQGGA